MKNKILILMTTLLLVTGLSYAQDEAPVSPKNVYKVKDTKTAQSVFLGSEIGDYVYAVMRMPDGKTKSFMMAQVEKGLVAYFATLQNKKVDYAYEIADCYIPEAGPGMSECETLIAVKYQNQSNLDWWNKNKANTKLIKELEGKFYDQMNYEYKAGDY